MMRESAAATGPIAVQTNRLDLIWPDRSMQRAIDEKASDPRVAAWYYGSRVRHHRTGSKWLAACRRGTRQLVGAVQWCRGEIGFFVSPESRRRGYAVEMVSAVCGVLSATGEGSLTACVARENIAGRAVVEDLGFVYLGMSGRRVGPTVQSVLNYRRTGLSAFGMTHASL